MSQTPQASNATLNLFGDLSNHTTPCPSTSKIAKIIATRTGNTAKRNERIIAVFNHKYNVERKRYDDVINELCIEFALAKSTIETVLKG